MLPVVGDHKKCMTFTLFQEMELIILDPTASIIVVRYMSDVSGIQAQRDNNAMQHLSTNNLLCVKPTVT